MSDNLKLARLRLSQATARITELGGRAAKDGRLASILSSLGDELDGSGPGNSMSGSSDSGQRFTRQEVSDAVNQAASYLQDSFEYEDSAVIEKQSYGDLLVNLALGWLDKPGAEPEEIIEENYGERPAEVLSWAGIPYEDEEDKENDEENIRLPDVTVHLSTGQDGNTMSVIAAVTQAMRRAGHAGLTGEFSKDIMSADSPDEALSKIMKWVNVT